jgi:TRAP-type C4-dicarboxylate transport system permease small subunit
MEKGNVPIKGLSSFMYWIGGAALLCIIFITVIDIILRRFRTGIVGTYEIVGFLGAFVVGFAIPQSFLDKAHVIMDSVIKALPQRLQKQFILLTRVLGIAMFGIIGWNLVVMGNEFLRSGEGSQTLHWPMYPIAYSLGFCCIVECLVLIYEISQVLKRGGA